MPTALLKRRDVVALVALPAIWTGLRAQPAAPRRPTPAQTEGPFYPVEIPKDSDFDLLRNGTANYTRGEPASTTRAANPHGWTAASPTCKASRWPARRSRSGNATTPATTTTHRIAARPIQRSRVSAA
jgi:hypothetical protein